VLCTAASLSSRNVRQEIQLAWRFGRPILPLRLEPVEFPDALAYWLEGAQWIDVLDHPPSRWLPLVQRALVRLEVARDVTDGHEPGPLSAEPTLKLPVPPTALLGRERELADIRYLVAGGARLLTLTGPGGTGKTRLALELARSLAPDFPQGAVFVDLSPVSDATLVLPTIAEMLGLHEAGEEPLAEQLRAFLQSKRLLLVLDNLEQVTAAAPDIASLVAVAPELVILATSRAPLRIRAEQEVVVGPLALPPAGEVVGSFMSPAVTLFLERAWAAGTELTLTATNAGTIAEIVRRLDGLPLAIELAAARTKLFPPQAMLARLERRLPLRTGGAPDLPARQQTLRNTIAWSHDLLSAAAQTLFRRLAIFTGGSSFEAIEAVAVPDGELDLYEGVAALVGQSLLRQDRSEGEPRFTMLETIREYALERLEASGEPDELRRRHARFFLGLAEEAEPVAGSVPDPAELERLETDHDNLRGALTWSLTAEPALALRLSAALAWFWELRGYLSEGRSWLGRALAADEGADLALRAKALWAVGDLAESQLDVDVAAAALTEPRALWSALGDQRGVARTLHRLGHVAIDQRDLASATELYTQSLALFHELGDERDGAAVLSGLGNVAYFRGEHHQAVETWREAAERFRALGDKRRLATVLSNIGAVKDASGEFEAAVRLHEEALDL
jgi:predicted ATPase